MALLKVAASEGRSTVSVNASASSLVLRNALTCCTSTRHNVEARSLKGLRPGNYRYIVSGDSMHNCDTKLMDSTTKRRMEPGKPLGSFESSKEKRDPRASSRRGAVIASNHGPGRWVSTYQPGDRTDAPALALYMANGCQWFSECLSLRSYQSLCFYILQQGSALGMT